MENDPNQFRSKGHALSFGVIADPIQAYVDLSREGIGFRQVKCDDVGEVVVFQEFAVDLQDPLVGGENIVHRPDPLVFFFKKR